MKYNIGYAAIIFLPDGAKSITLPLTECFTLLLLLECSKDIKTTKRYLRDGKG